VKVSNLHDVSNQTARSEPEVKGSEFFLLSILSGALNNKGNYSPPECNVCNTVRWAKFLYPWLAPMSIYQHSKLSGPKYTEIPSACKILFVEEQWMTTSLWIPRCIQMRVYSC